MTAVLLLSGPLHGEVVRVTCSLEDGDLLYVTGAPTWHRHAPGNFTPDPTAGNVFATRVTHLYRWKAPTRAAEYWKDYR